MGLTISAQKAIPNCIRLGRPSMTCLAASTTNCLGAYRNHENRGSKSTHPSPYGRTSAIIVVPLLPPIGASFSSQNLVPN